MHMAGTTSFPELLFVVNVDWFFISHRLPIALAAQRQGYKVHIATGITSHTMNLEDCGFTVHPLRLERGATNLFLVLRTFLEIYFVIKKVNPDLIHFITIKPILLGGIASHFFKHKGLVFSVSGLGYIFSSDGIKSKLRQFATSCLYWFALRHIFIKVIFQNKHDLRTVSNIVKLKSSEYALIPGSGVDLDKYSPALIPKGLPIVLFAARLLSSKGIYEFAEASTMVSGARFVIAGQFDTDNRECLKPHELQQWVQSGSIEYWGFSDSAAELINQSSIVVLPSYYGEGLPKILIEAAACAKPVITTDHPGCRDAIEPGISGLLVPVRDANALATAIKKLLDDPDLCKSMGLAGRALAERKFDIKQVVQTHLDIYADMLSSSS